MEPLELKGAFKKLAYKKLAYIYLFEKRNLADAAAIHFTVPKEEEEYFKHKLPLKKSIIIPNGIDPADLNEESPAGYFRNKFNIGKNKKIVLFLSRISWKKGLDTLIPACAEVFKNFPDALLVIVGGDDEGYQKNVEDMINKNGIKNNVIFAGLLLGKDKIAAFRESDVFVLPSYSENFGMAVIEAMHFGLPVVITPEVGIAKRIEEAKAGLVVKKETKAVAEAIKKIISNKDLAEEMGEYGRELVEKEFLMPSIA